MGLSNFPSAVEGVLPVIVMNTVLSVALLKNMFRSLLQLLGATTSIANSSYSPNLDQDSDQSTSSSSSSSSSSLRERRVSITQYRLLCHNHKMGRSPSRSCGVEWCCVCLCGFEANEEVSELSCKHFFHRGCLDKWFHNNHTTCPLCRSID